MNVYKTEKIENILKPNPYAGRGIIIGKSENSAVVAYFIMGRSENSRNRIFEEKGSEVIISLLQTATRQIQFMIF